MYAHACIHAELTATKKINLMCGFARSQTPDSEEVNREESEGKAPALSKGSCVLLAP